MKRFGEPFETYKTFRAGDLVVHDSFESLTSQYVQAENASELACAVNSTKGGTPIKAPRKSATPSFFVLDDKEKQKIMRKIKVGASPVANVYAISPQQKDLSEAIIQNMPYFNYYIVELGLNVRVGEEAVIPNLEFRAELFSDSKTREDVTTNSIAPNDEIKKIKIVDGTVKIGISKLLEFIPVVGPVASEAIKIDINPIEFKLEKTKYMVDASGAHDYTSSWSIYGTEVAQNFNPLMILKARKNVTSIWAMVDVKYTLKKHFKSIDVNPKPIKVKILPV